MNRDGRFLLLLACFALSGLAALIYQTAWTQQFALVFGASELAVATVLAAYMAGLMAGAAIAGRLVVRIRRPVLLYALLELGIALSALAVPAALKLATRLQVALIGGVEVPPEAGSLTSALFYLGASFLILLVPTALMGATLPLLARYAVHRDAEVGPRVGLLYTANTVGAAAGTLFAAFLLLPRLGLAGTVLVAVAANVLVFVLAAILARGHDAGDVSTTDVAPASSDESRPVAAWILPLILISGFVSFTWEVLWTRILSHLLGGSIYAFGTMLATFLAGIALGSAVASRWATDSRQAGRGFTAAQIGIAVSSFAAFALVDRLPNLAGDLAGSGGAFTYSAPLAAATLLPGALFIGATFPFAVRMVTPGAAQAGPASARVYAWNTLGAIAGAVATGFVLLPSLRIAGTAALAIAVSLALALAAALLARPRQPALALVALAGLVVLALAPPQTPWQVLRYSPLTGKQAAGELAFYGVGRSATVLLTDEGLEWRLTTDGLPEAGIERRGARAGRFAMAQWLARLPQVARPEMKSALIVGLGAGLTLEAVPSEVEEIDVVELEPEVVLANRSKADERRGDPLADPRLRLHVNDARSALLLTEKRFDAIMSQPSHPWTAGASHLFTREFFQLVRQRLQPSGVFTQWIGLQFVDAELLRSLMATLVDVFPHVELYQPYPGGGVLFLCSPEPLAVEETAVQILKTNPVGWHQLGVFVAEDILADRLLDAAGSRRFAADAPLNTDYHNLLQTRAPRILQTPLRGEGTRRLLADLDPLPEIAADSDHGIYMVRRLMRVKVPDRARRLADSLRDPAERQVALALTHLATGRPRLGEEMLWRALELAPESSSDAEPRAALAAREAFHALLLHRRGGIQEDENSATIDAHLARDAAAAAVLEGWRLIQARRPLAVRRLDTDLATVGPRHPLFETVTVLRISWRLASGDPALAREGLAMLEPQLAHGVQGGAGLLQRARLGAVVSDSDVVLGSLLELAPLIRRQPAEDPKRVRLVREALRVLSSLPAPLRENPTVTKLKAQLSGAGQGEAQKT